MLRVALLDDHPAVLAGLQRLLDSTSDLEAACVSDNAPQLLREIDRVRPDVAVLDYDLARGDGLTLCQTLKARVRPPAVVIYSACAGPGLAISSRLAGADAVVDKRAPASELIEIIRRVAVHGVRRIVGQLRPTECAPSTADTYCRRCHTTFHRPLPQPYGPLCPGCIADGDIVTLTAAPDAAHTRRPGRTSGRRLVSGARRTRRRSRVSGDA